jgi:hypothetical protein
MPGDTHHHHPLELVLLEKIADRGAEAPDQY